MLTVHSLQISNGHEVMNGHPGSVLVVLHEPGNGMSPVGLVACREGLGLPADGLPAFADIPSVIAWCHRRLGTQWATFAYLHGPGQVHLVDPFTGTPMLVRWPGQKPGHIACLARSMPAAFDAAVRVLNEAVSGSAK